MAKIMRVSIAGTYRSFSAENIIFIDRPTTTTTTINYQSGSASGDVLTFTHAADSGFVVRTAIEAAWLALHDPTQKKMKYLDAVIPTTFVPTAVAIS
jgi:hypothetical protein